MGRASRAATFQLSHCPSEPRDGTPPVDRLLSRGRQLHADTALHQRARATAAASRPTRGIFSRGVALSLTLHVAIIAGLLLLRHHNLSPAGELAPVELVMVPAPSEPATTAPGPPPPQEPVATPRRDTESEPRLAPAPAAEATPLPVPKPVPVPMPQSPSEPKPEPAPKSMPEPLPKPAPSPTQAVVEQPRPALQPRAEPAPHPPQQPRPHSPARTAPSRAHRDTKRRLAAPPAAVPPAPASPPASAQQEARADSAWLARVGTWLMAHRVYPEMARRRGRQGTVTVQITVDPLGHVLDVNLIRSSGSESLDQAAQTLLRSAHLPPFPSGMAVARQSVTIPIRYRLE